MSNKVIVFGNQKGGTGKSTLAMHLVVNLLHKGYKVGTIDVDAKQGTFTHYIENREKTKRENPEILTPVHSAIIENESDSITERDKENLTRFGEIMYQYRNFDFIVIDTPGSETSLSKIAHSFADKIITPMNESFVDLDLLVRIKDVKSNVLRPSIYAQMVWDQKKEKAMRQKGSIDWIVLVNRMSNAASKNRQDLEKVLNALAPRMGFRFIKGFKERVVFRELFLYGLTLLDKKANVTNMNMSHIAAQQELNDMLAALNI